MESIDFYKKRFVAGVTNDEAISVVKILNSKNITAALDILGEDLKDRKDIQKSLEDYIKLIDDIYNSKVESYVSIKLSMLGLLVDYNFCKENMFKLLEAARNKNIFIRIDIEYFFLRESTLKLFYEMKNHFDNLGIVLQSNLYVTEKDLNDAVKFKSQIRLCKGAYNEGPDKALKNPDDIRKRFIKFSKILLQKGEYPAFATHDIYLIDKIKKIAEDESVDRNLFEFQFLYGYFENEFLYDIAKDGYKLRIYIPYGPLWEPYVRRRISEIK